MSPGEPRNRKDRRLFRQRRVRTALYACCAALLAGAFVWGALLCGQGAQAPPAATQRPQSVPEAAVPLAQPVESASSRAKTSPSPAPAMDTAAAAEDVIGGCTLVLPSLGLELPVSPVCTDEALLRSVCKFSGPQPGQKGNYVIAGHDFVSGAQFARLNELRPGDGVILRDRQNGEYAYAVYALELVTPEDVRALDVPANAAEVTLLTCADRNTKRLLVRCRLSPAQTPQHSP